MRLESNVEWQKWAKTDPLFGISTITGKEKTGEHPWTLNELYAFGETVWADFKPHWESYGLNYESCLEIGCAVGRITHQLVKCFDNVMGIDISSEMMEIARANIPNASFGLTDGTTIPTGDDTITAVFSCEVFQHLEPRDAALAYFREIFRVLKPNGTCMIQIPIVILPFARVWPAMVKLQAFLWRFSDRWIHAKSRLKRLLILHYDRRPFYRMLQYEPEWLLSQLTDIGFTDIQIRLVQVFTGNARERRFSDVLFARKPAMRAHT
jgi:ubiquinone/menaquinone biosynthesis C-methylase UbiE